MITIIFGAPGAGKTSLNTYFLKEVYSSQGQRLLRATRERIAKLNIERTTLLSLPDKPPIFSNFPVKLKHGFEPYFLNPYFFGLSNDRMATQFLPPKSQIFITEGQRYFDSRQSGSFPAHVSRAFEMGRHYGMNFYIDCQRPDLIDKNIRMICTRFIEVRSMEHQTDENDRILQTTFHCRTFPSFVAVEAYLGSGEQTYTEENFINEGNIFRAFNSYGCFDEFVPPEGKNFVLLPFRQNKRDEANETFYRTEEPKEYRIKVSGSKK